MFAVVLFHNYPNWKPHKCPSLGEWIKNNDTFIQQDTSEQ